MDANSISILNVTVSCFANYRTADNPKSVNLLKWLTSAKYASQVSEIRATADKAVRDRLKSTLPAITPSGIFSHRKKDGLLHHSGILCLDIDFKDNDHILNFNDLKTEIGKMLFVAYCGLSVSGNGFFVLVPIAHPDSHEQHFAALENDFASFGIILDPSGKDVCRLRGYSFDDAAFFRQTLSVILFRQIRGWPFQYEFRLHSDRENQAALV